MKILVKSDNVGTSNSDQFTLPLLVSETYNFDIDWGDGSSIETITSSTSPTHTFLGGAGTYELTITENVAGGFPTIRFNNGGDRLKLLELSEWGTNQWSTMNGSFYGCANLQITATDHATAVTGDVTNMDTAFRDCSSITTFPLIDTSGCTTFDQAWWGCSSMTSFPALDMSSGTSFYYTWYNCSSLTSFPLITLGNGNIELTKSWRGCSGLESFPLINTSTVTNINAAWQDCTSLATFPLLDLSSVTDAGYAWQSCPIVDFPNVDLSNCTVFYRTWRYCSSIVNFPSLDMRSMTEGDYAFDGAGVSIPESSYSDILEILAQYNLNTGVTFDAGNSQYYPRAADDKTVLTGTRTWNILDAGETAGSESSSSESSSSDESSSSSDESSSSEESSSSSSESSSSEESSSSSDESSSSESSSSSEESSSSSSEESSSSSDESSSSESSSSSEESSSSSSESSESSSSDGSSSSSDESSSSFGDDDGTACWGHTTGVEESLSGSFKKYWSGTGGISELTGDDDCIGLSSGQYLESNPKYCPSITNARIILNKYGTGLGDSTPIVEYKTGNSLANCESDAWKTFSINFINLGWIKIRIRLL